MRSSIGVVWLLAAGIGLAGCTPQEGLPPNASSAESFPDAAYRSDFNFTQAVRDATSACVASEQSGPSELTALLRKDFVLYSQLGQTGYMKAESKAGKGLLDKIKAVRVYDPSSQISCNISVFRGDAYSALAAISNEMERLGYSKVERGRFVRYIGNGRRFTVDGSTSLSDAWARIRVSLVPPSQDRLCKDTALPADIRQACN
jgi:hypothetical protein